MKLREEFHVPVPVADVWTFFEQPDSVAKCMPGVEQVTVVDSDNVNIRATQSIGPMSATFEAKIKIVERVPEQLIRFTATGRSVRGAMGNIRAANTVELEGVEQGTRVIVEGDIALAGALGTVGQKVVAKQTNKVTAEFAENLATLLGGGQLEGRSHGRSSVRQPSTASEAQTAGGLANSASDPWPRVSAAFSALSAVLSVIVLVAVRRKRG
jgi:carbon monoxide dehydrogenase subunit G